MVEIGKNNKWRGRIFRYAPLILWIGVIFYFSTRNASMSNTSRFIRPILEFLFPNASESTLVIYHAYIRKFAHFAEYAGLAFFASRAFWDSSQRFLQKCWYLAALFLVLLIASMDELNQSFDPTRTGSIYDVMIDAFGGSVMILVLLIFNFFRNKDKKNIDSEAYSNA